jgi:hypothetical protein
MRYSLAICSLLVACTVDTTAEPETGSEDPPSSGIDPSLKISALDSTQRQALCSWELALMGGAGSVHHCEECDGDACTDWTATILTQEKCVEQLAGYGSCGVDVGDLESCALAQAPDVCVAEPDECAVFAPCL